MLDETQLAYSQKMNRNSHEYFVIYGMIFSPVESLLSIKTSDWWESFRCIPTDQLSLSNSTNGYLTQRFTDLNCKPSLVHTLLKKKAEYWNCPRQVWKSVICFTGPTCSVRWAIHSVISNETFITPILSLTCLLWPIVVINFWKLFHSYSEVRDIWNQQWGQSFNLLSRWLVNYSIYNYRPGYTLVMLVANTLAINCSQD